ERKAPADPADDATDQHRNREPEIVVDGEIGNYGRHDAAEDRSQMVTEGARRSPRLGRKPLGHVRWNLATGAAAKKRPLQNVADHDYPVIGTEHVEERHRDPQQPRDDHRPAATDPVADKSPRAARQEDYKVGNDDRRSDQCRAEAEVLLQMR